MKIWNARTGQELWSSDGLGSTASWSPDGRFIASGGRTIRIWDARTGQLLIAIETPWQINFIAWSPDGSKILSYGNDLNSIKIWDVETARELRTITTGHNIGGIRSVIWSPDGNFIASGADDGTIRIYGSRTQDFEQILR